MSGVWPKMQKLNLILKKKKKKTSDKPQMRDILQNNRPELISSVKPTKDKERMRNC